MDKLEKYRRIIISIVGNHAKYKPSHGKIEALCICDQESDNYLLMDTERGITGELLELGVEKDDIILGFIRPEYRQFTDFSVA